MAQPKHKPRDDAPPEPLEAGLKGPDYSTASGVEDLGADEYLLLKVVEANAEHLRTMRWTLGIGVLLLLLDPLLYALYGVVAALLWNLAAGALLAVGLQALARQLELLRRAAAATDHFVFGEGGESQAP